MLRIKKSFKSIISPNQLLVLNYRWNLFEKVRILKSRWAYWEANLTATSLSGKEYGKRRKKYRWKSENNTLETTDINLIFLYSGISPSQAHALNWFPETTYFPQPHQQQRDLFWFMKSRPLIKSIWVKKEKGHILMIMNHQKNWR